MKAPIDKFQETYQGKAYGPEKLASGSVIVIKDPIQQKYLAVKLGPTELLAGKYKAFTTGNKGLYIRDLKEDSPMPIHDVTSSNSKINLALATMGQFIHYDSTSTMKQVYEKHLFDTCIQDRKDIAVSTQCSYIII